MTSHPFGNYAVALEKLRQDLVDARSPVAWQIISARTHRARAALVLRLSDDVVVEAFDDLKSACYEVRFPAGATYISLRLAATCATRDAAGRMPTKLAGELELWRRGLAALAEVQS